MCIVFCGGFDWMVFVELVAFDTIENLFHLGSLARDKQRSFQEHSDNLHKHSGTQVYMVSVLLLRELCEIMIPAQFLAWLSLIQLIHPRFNDITCGMSSHQLRSAQFLLVADLGVEIFLMSITILVLWYYGFRPFGLVRSLVSKEFAIMVSSATGVFAYFVCLHHSHLGVDLTFTFQWLQSDNAKWDCGLHWHP